MRVCREGYLPLLKRVEAVFDMETLQGWVVCQPTRGVHLQPVTMCCTSQHQHGGWETHHTLIFTNFLIKVML